MKKYKNTLSIHMMVCNEERWVWYAIMSVIEYADELIIFDTGSTDLTVEIIKTIMDKEEYSNKILFEEKGKVNREEFVVLRNEMVQKTRTDYFLVVDGDEIYYEDQMIKLRNALDSDEMYELGVTGFICCAGDVRHFRNPLNERYCHGDKIGSITHRLTSMHIEGIKCGSSDGKWDGYYDKNDVLIAAQNGFKTYWADGFYLHMSNMLRSSDFKSDKEVGWPSGRFHKLIHNSTWDAKFPDDFKYPEVFYIQRPIIVSSPWNRDPGLLRWGMQLLKNVFLEFRKDKIRINHFDITICYKKKDE